MKPKLINLRRISVIQIAQNEKGSIYVVFQDGRHNYGCKVKNLEEAEKIVNDIKTSDMIWFEVPSKIFTVTFKKEEKE